MKKSDAMKKSRHEGFVVGERGLGCRGGGGVSGQRAVQTTAGLAECAAIRNHDLTSSLQIQFCLSLAVSLWLQLSQFENDGEGE